MKIYTKIKLDLLGNEIESESFEYQGPVAWCFGGGGGGATSYPAYYEDFHSEMLAHNQTDSPNSSYVDLLNSALASASPYFNETAYDPDTVISTMETKIGDFEIEVATRNPITEWIDQGTQAGTKGASLFPDDDVSSDIATEISTAITNAASEIADAHGDALANVDLIVAAATTRATTALDAAKTAAVAAAAAALTNSSITDAVNEFEKRAAKAHARAINRYTAGMADINAVMGSAFIVGMSLLEADHLDRVNEYQKEIELDLFRNTFQSYLTHHIQTIADQIRLYGGLVSDQVNAFTSIMANRISAFTQVHVNKEAAKDRFITGGVREMSELVQFEMDRLLQISQERKDIGRLKIIAKSEESDRNLEIDVADTLWDFDLMQLGGNLLSSGQGAMMPKDRLTRGQSVLGGALSGASVGAKFGPTGAAVGAGIGALIGGIS